jgi:hypothetical protein
VPPKEWESFYVILGSSAAALTGLMFVVVALQADKRLRSGGAIAAFGTPTIVHFGAVLLLAALLTAPHPTEPILPAALVATGAAGLVYVACVIRRARRQNTYAPELSDWVWHGALPLGAYGALLVLGLVFERSADAALYGVGGVALLLLFIGIHNAWDAAVWIATQDQGGPGSTPAARPSQ